MPTEQCPGRDKEGSQPRPGKEAAERGKESTVGSSVLDSEMKLALEDAHLVTEDDQLDVLVDVAAPGRGHERQNAAKPKVDESKTTTDDARRRRGVPAQSPNRDCGTLHYDNILHRTAQ